MVKKIGILSLGCARNLVDSEVFAARLNRKGYKIIDLDPTRDTISNQIDEADIALVNTCAFIKEAKQESIQAILDLIEAKSEGRLKKIIVAGCLSQRYKYELFNELPEVDAFSGVLSLNHDHAQERFRLTPAHYAYVKICEGCINNCSFCAIPGIKTRFSSRPLKSVIQELKALDRQGCVEANLIGQDITAYGRDLYGQFRLADLIKEILKNTGSINWLRLLYLAPERVSEELIELIASSERIVKYVDLPLQHINNRILKLMRRNIDSGRIRRLIDNIRSRIPGVAIRTSLIVGFPGETDKEFRQLLDFVEQTRFERLGMFMYSREENTTAFSLPGQVPQKVKEERYNKIMSSQQGVARQINQAWQGKIIEVLVEEKQENGLYIGRSQHDAPEVDGLVYLRAKKELPIGSFVNAKITDTLEYDLVGEVG
jgi:ribosomal protein S12 methylthiotransferase